MSSEKNPGMLRIFDEREEGGESFGIKPKDRETLASLHQTLTWLDSQTYLRMIMARVMIKESSSRDRFFFVGESNDDTICKKNNEIDVKRFYFHVCVLWLHLPRTSAKAKKHGMNKELYYSGFWRSTEVAFALPIQPSRVRIFTVGQIQKWIFSCWIWSN